MSRIKVGIIGNGFVGEAQAFAFSTVADVYIYDIDVLKSKNSLNQVHDCEFVFVCVPTPMKRDGSQDLNAIENVFKQAKKATTYILKSTVLPGTSDMLSKKYNLDIVFSPEFLTERTAKLDMLTQSRIILGGKKNLTDKVENLFNSRFKNKHIIKTDFKTAELIKYMNNNFFAAKVSLMNEFKLVCDAIGANWEDALHGFSSDGRIGDSHLNVPGHDGKLGFGGTCFPKDVKSFLIFSESLKINLNTISGAWKTNIEIRPEKDWEKKIGRAVSFDPEKNK